MTSTPVVIPNVTGMTLSNAESILAADGLILHVPNFTTIPRERRAQHRALPDTRRPHERSNGSEGDSLVLSPTATFPLPSVAGQTQTQATTTLVQDSLKVSATTSTACSNTVATGLVVSTMPAAASQVSAGTSIELITSSGVCEVVVPNVVNLSQSAATTQLNAQGLTATVTAADPTSCLTLPAGTVVAQSVPGGSEAPYNLAVGLSVCQGVTATTAVPER